MALAAGSDQPTHDELCVDALSAYEQMLEIREPDSRTEPLLHFVGDGPEPQPMGEARYSGHGRWLCHIELAR